MPGSNINSCYESDNPQNLRRIFVQSRLGHKVKETYFFSRENSETARLFKKVLLINHNKDAMFEFL